MAKLALLGGEPIRTKPFPGWPMRDEREIAAATRVITSGKWGIAAKSGEGEVATFEKDYASYHGAKHGVCSNSGTTAIRVALQALGTRAGDEIIAPAYTFIGSVTPIMDLFAIPVFVDIDPTTYTIDPAAVERAITPRTRGILPVHFAGLPANMDALKAIAAKHDLWIMEDAAQAWGAQWKGTGVGHIGGAGIFSFQSSKNITSGEGGITLTDSDETVELLRSYANCGRSSTGIWYGHYRIAGNFRMPEILGAILRVQLDRYPEFHARREASAQYLAKRIAQIPGQEPLRRPPEVTKHAQHLFIWRYFAKKFGGVPRAKFLEAMRAEGIPSYHGYSVPLYKQPVFAERLFDPSHPAQAMDFAGTNCPEAERACNVESCWLTQTIMLGDEKDMDDIANAVEKVYENRAALLAQPEAVKK